VPKCKKVSAPLKELLHSLWIFAVAAWPFTKTVAGAIAATITFSYAGIKAVLELIDRARNRWDGKVQDFLDSHIQISGYVMPNNIRAQKGTPKTMAEIKEATGFSEKRILACLGRLKRKRLVSQKQGGLWRADAPPHCSA